LRGLPVTRPRNRREINGHQTRNCESRNPPAQGATACGLTELALKFRNGEAGKVTMSEVVRMTGRAARLLAIRDKDERVSVENAATIQIAKAHNLVA